MKAIMRTMMLTLSGSRMNRAGQTRRFNFKVGENESEQLWETTMNPGT